MLAFLLQKRVGHCGEAHVAVPPGIGSTLEMVEPEFVLEVLILLLDGPPLMREPDELLQGGRGRQMNEKILGDVAATHRTLREQPDFGREMTLPPLVGRRDANRGKLGAPARGLVLVVPRDAAPRARRQRGRQFADCDRFHLVEQAESGWWTAPTGGRRGCRDAWCAWEDGQMRRDSQRIGQIQPMQRFAK